MLSSGFFTFVLKSELIFYLAYVAATSPVSASEKHAKCMCMEVLTEDDGSLTTPVVHVGEHVQDEYEDCSPESTEECTKRCKYEAERWNKYGGLYEKRKDGTTEGQFICRQLQDDVKDDKYVGVYVRFCDRFVYSGVKTKNRLCCANHNQYNCNELEI
ncbi:Uncharacterised protein g4197 [Pycnogonum litorale]